MNREPIFDAVADVLPGVWNVTGTVALMDRIIDLFEGPKTGGDFEQAIIAHLRFEEGVRAKAYKDHLGYWTIGVGRLLDSRKGGRITPEEDAILLANDASRKGQPWRAYVLTDGEINMLLKNDIERFTAAIRDWPAWKALGDNVARQVALTSMAFQLGTAGLAAFKNSLRMVEQGRFGEAADNMMKSRWAKQTPSRAKRITGMMRTGTLP